MSEPQSIESSVESIDREPLPTRTSPHPRAIGSPLSTGSSRRSASNANRIPAGASSRALPGAADNGEPSTVQRAVNAVRVIIPLVQRLLPLLDGNVITAISNLIAPRPPAPPQPKIDLAPLEHKLAELQTQRQSLRDQVAEQSASIKRVEDQLEMVREATDRNTLEQQELLEDLKTFSGRVKVVAILAIAVLLAGFVLNLVLFLHIQRVLP